MKVAWLQDYSRIGGAELTCKTAVDVGESLGHDIVGITPGSFKSYLLYQCDVLIINNFFQFNPEQMQHIFYAIYEQRVPYIMFEHDHRNIDRPALAGKLFRNSRLNVFLSPLHLDNFHSKLGVSGICLPLAIDVGQYKSVPGVKREPQTALVSNVRNFKRWKALQAYVGGHPGITFTILADQSPVGGTNVEIKPMVSASKMSEVYSSHEYLVHLLDGRGAGERVIFEAALCGCKIVANEGVGHMSWGRDLADIDPLREWLKEAPYKFWQAVRGAII